MIALDSKDQKPLKNTAKFLLKKHFMRNKLSGNLNRRKIRILPGGKLSYSFFSGQNLLENVIKHCLSVISRFPPMTCSRLTLL